MSEKPRVPWDFAPADGPTFGPNVPTPEGRELGIEVARHFENAWAKSLAQFPNQQPPCNDCAFKRGTDPNGCPETLLEAIKCVVEGVPFFCHKGVPDGETPKRFCMGWLVSYGEFHRETSS